MKKEQGKGEWKRAPAELVDAFLSALPKDAAVERRKMFGFDCAFTGGNMFAGLCPLGLVLRLGDEEREHFLALRGTSRFEMRGRVMREYVVVPEAMTRDRRRLRTWIGCAFAFASVLPVKPKQQERAAS